MKKYYSLLILLFLFIDLSAQQLPIFTQYRENHGYINPASLNSDYFTGENNLSFSISHRHQWVGFKGSPKTQTVKGEYIFHENTVGLILGGYLINDETDPIGTTGIFGRLGGLISNDPSSYGFSIGMNLGVMQYRIAPNELRVMDGNDISLENNLSVWNPDVGFGIYYYQSIGSTIGDYFYTGFSVPQTFGVNVDFKNTSGDFQLERIRHYYGLAGYYKNLGDLSFVEGSVWIKYVPNSPLNVDFNIRYQLEGVVWIGTGLSTARVFHLEAGLNIGEDIFNLEDFNIRIGYGYDHSFSSIGASGQFGNSHEINISYSRKTYSYQ